MFPNGAFRAAVNEAGPDGLTGRKSPNGA